MRALIFGLSFTAYALLTLRLVGALRLPGRGAPTGAALGARHALLARLAAAAIVPHVFLVWHVRFDWSLERSLANGPVGWSLFHAAFLLLSWMGVDPNARGRWRALTTLAWLAVTPSVAAAPLRYEFLRPLAAPLWLLGALGLLTLLAWVAGRRRRA